MLYITSLCSKKERIDEAIKELAQLGFKNIELTGKTKFYSGIKKDLFDLKNKYQLNFLIHNYFPPQADEFVLNLASEDAALKEKTLTLIKEAVGLLREFEVELYSIHPGFRKDLSPKLQDGFFANKTETFTRRENFYQMLDFVVKEIVPEGFRIAVENLCPKASTDLYSFVSSPRDIEEFLGFFQDKPNIGILLDFGHLNVTSNYLNFDKAKIAKELFLKYKDRIFEVHLSENDGYKDSHNISSIDSWQIELLAKNKEAIRDIPIVLEWHYAAGPSAYRNFEAIKNKLGF